MGVIELVGKWFQDLLSIVNGYYMQLVPLWPFGHILELKYALIIAVAILFILLIIIIAVISNKKKRKIKYFVDDKLFFKEKVKYRGALNFPIVEKDGKEFVGWYIDKKYRKKFESETLNKKKSLKLYAKFNDLYGEEKADDIYDGDFLLESLQNYELGKIYDNIRYEMLGYERATPFKNVGVTRKQIVAEMFERDGVINLYLAIDPELMIEKGYSVSKYLEPEFAIVPCKKVVKNNEDYLEAIKLIKEAMILNNFVKSEPRRIERVQSDEQTRKNGFAFYVKNEVVATSAGDYYKLLRAIVLSYSLAPGRQFPKNHDNMMILKIFKKDEQIFLYLALDADKEGLEFVGYDKNFADTPALYEIKISDNVIRANQLIDKLMYRFGMEKHPEQAELAFDEGVNKNCGFGYRIRH